MRAVNLTSEYLTDPLGIDVLSPLLMWQVEGVRKQTAFEIVYSVNNGEEIHHQEETDRMNFRYTELPHSGDFISWKVRIRDEKGQWSDYSSSGTFSFGLLHKEDWKASWIEGNYSANKKKRYPVDVFEKDFEISSFSKAVVYVSALGLYEMEINGQRVGHYVLTPGSTDYRVRVQYDTYDVSSFLKEGKNHICIYLGDGWYRGSIGAKGFTYVFGKKTKVLMQLEILDGNHQKQYVVSDTSFSWHNASYLRFADLKDGEVVDMNVTPNEKLPARKGNYKGIISSSDNTHVEEMDYFAPIREISTPSGAITYEFPHNLAGYISFRATAKKGSQIHIRLGELLDEKEETTLKNVQCIRKGKKTPLQEIHFTCKDGNNEYKSKFFYGGFHYATVTFSGEVKDFEIRQIELYSKMAETSHFECDNPFINIFYENTIRSTKSNSVDIPTDCPTRERMGWTGDSQLFFNTASYVMDYAAFTRKHIRDVYDRQRKDGCLPQIAPYSAEDWFMDVMNGSVGWADVGVLTPYHMYQKYGDTGILEEYYDRMKKYAEFMIKRCGFPKGIYAVYAKPLHLSKANRKYGVNTGQSYGEWAEPNDVKAFVWTDFAEPHPEESMAYTSYLMSIMVKIATLLNKTEDIPLYEEYRDGVKKAYQELVSKPNFSLDTNRQAKLVRPLYMHLLSPEQETYAKKRLIAALDAYHWRLGTGFLSTPYILTVLSDIDTEAAYRLLENEEMPGWLYMAKHNTGTIWEGWEGPNAQQGISSLNHYSKGAMVEWLFSGMLGINVIGENAFLLKPVIGGKETYAKGNYDSVYGSVYLSWEKKEKKIHFEIEVPANCRAHFVYNQTDKELEAGHYSFDL